MPDVDATCRFEEVGRHADGKRRIVRCTECGVELATRAAPEKIRRVCDQAGRASTAKARVNRLRRQQIDRTFWFLPEAAKSLLASFLAETTQWALALFPIRARAERRRAGAMCNLCPYQAWAVTHVGWTRPPKVLLWAAQKRAPAGWPARRLARWVMRRRWWHVPLRLVERCAECGCWTPLKRLYATAECPAQMWPGQKHYLGQGLLVYGQTFGAIAPKGGCGGGCGGKDKAKPASNGSSELEPGGRLGNRPSNGRQTGNFAGAPGMGRPFQLSLPSQPPDEQL